MEENILIRPAIRPNDALTAMPAIERFELFHNEIPPNCSFGGDVDFIYNRFDLFAEDWYVICFSCAGRQYALTAARQGKRLQLGVWLVRLPDGALCEVIRLLFLHLPDLEEVLYENSLTPAGRKPDLRNHFRIELPGTEEGLHSRLSAKHRYNLRRERKIIENELGPVEFAEFTGKIPGEIVEEYFRFKRMTHGVDYHMTSETYLKTFHVTHAYLLSAGKKCLGIVFSCEQCPIVYIENLTYNPEFARFSPGQVLYDHYLVRLIEKGNREIYLYGGNLSYKKRYGSTEETVYRGRIYRSAFVFFSLQFKRGFNRICLKPAQAVCKRVFSFPPLVHNTAPSLERKP